jgi:hypothetical protein
MKKILLGESMRGAVLSSVFLLAAAATTSGCSSKSAAPYPDVTSFCAAKAQAECQIAATCGSTSPTACETAREALCNEDAAQAAMTGSGTRKYTQANAPACIAKANDVYGNNVTQIPFASLVGPGSVTDVCEHVFAGVSAFNAPCQTDYDCADVTDICVPVLPGSTDLVCATATPVAAGKFCQDPGSQCADDTYCTMASANGGYTCVAEAQEGAPCADAPCVDTARCVSGTCEPRATANEPCTTNDDCSPDAPYCDPYVGNLCEKGLSFATQAPDCKGFESASGSTVLAPTGDAGVTVGPPADAATGG